MSLAGITQHCKIMYSQSVQAQAGFSRQWLWFFRSLLANGSCRIRRLPKPPRREQDGQRVTQRRPGNSAPPALLLRPWAQPQTQGATRMHLQDRGMIKRQKDQAHPLTERKSADLRKHHAGMGQVSAPWEVTSTLTHVEGGSPKG